MENLRKSGKSQGKMREFHGIKKVGTLPFDKTFSIHLSISSTKTDLYSKDMWYKLIKFGRTLINFCITFLSSYLSPDSKNLVNQNMFQEILSNFEFWSTMAIGKIQSCSKSFKIHFCLISCYFGHNHLKHILHEFQVILINFGFLIHSQTIALLSHKIKVTWNP